MFITKAYIRTCFRINFKVPDKISGNYVICYSLSGIYIGIESL